MTLARAHNRDTVPLICSVKQGSHIKKYINNSHVHGFVDNKEICEAIPFPQARKTCKEKTCFCQCGLKHLPLV